jgi:glutaconate CoA-transferase subunit B
VQPSPLDARAAHQSDLRIGTLETRPDVLRSIGDGDLCATALTTVSVPEIFRYWLQGGRITVGFLGGAQVDRFANLNSTVIGVTRYPRCACRAPADAAEIATGCRQVFIVMKQSRSKFVKKVDFVTSLGHGRTGRERGELGIATRGPTLLVTDLCIMRPEPDTNEMIVTSSHPGATRAQMIENTGWDVRFANHVEETSPPTVDELEILRELQARTARAHGARVGEL